MSSILRSSKFVRYFFGLARSLVISNRQEFDGGILQRTHHLAGLFSNNFSSSPLRLQSGSLLEKSVRQLDEDARRTGRVSITEIEEALNSIKNTRRATATQSLMVIRCCGNLIPEESPEHRTKLVEEIWNTFEKLGVPLDVSHYNALLKVYLENEHKFSPTEFLAKMEENGIEPNRVTYQRLIAGFCQQGDIEGATKILEFMKEKQIPVSEGVFNALILGHSKAEDMESAEAILNMMRQASLEPSNETYTMLLSGYAARGDAEAIQRLLTECKVKDVLLSDKDFLEIGYSAAINGHDQLLDEILKNIRHSMGYNQEAANMILRLVTAGKDEAGYKVFLSMSPPVRTDTWPNMSGHLFIKHLVRSNRSADQILLWCERLQKDGHTSLGLWIAVETSFHFRNTDLTLDLLRALKQKQEPIRPHYFWPSLSTAGKTSDFNRMNDILKTMISEFELPVSSETLRDYVLPYIPSPQSTTEILKSLDKIGVKRGQAVVGIISHLLNKNNAKEAAELALQHPSLNFRNHLTARQLTDVLQSTDDVHSVVSLVHILASPRTIASREDEKDEEEETGSAEEVVSRFLISLVSYAPTRTYVADVLKEMVERGLAISSVCAEIVENKLQGRELTSEISNLLAKLSSGTLEYQAIKRVPTASPTMRTPEMMERIKERVKANNEPAERIISCNRSLYQLYCHEGDVENALRIKKELEEEFKEEATPGMWAGLLDAYCIKNDLDGAKSCLEKIKVSGSDFELDPQKILKMAKLYIENNQFDEAIELVKSVKPRHKGDGGVFLTRNHVWHTLQATAETYKDPELVKKLLNVLAELKYVDFSNAMLGPIIKAYLLRDDLVGALKEFEECVRLHRATPYKTELAMRLIEKEDATNLQTLVDLSTQVHGEVNSLYDLVLNFIECGRVRQARKILETPGLATRNNRILLACERYKKEGKSDYLESLIEVTKDLSYIDRSEIYNSLLDTYCEAEQVEKALGLWTKMQDEDVNITDEFLIKLGNFLKLKGHQVPFKIPNKKLVAFPPVEQETVQTSLEPRSPFMVAIGKRDVDEALRIKDELENSGKKLSRNEINRLLELLVEQSRLRDAASLVTSLSQEKLPAVRILNYLITRLAMKGETELLHRVDEHLPESIKKLTSISNRHMHAAVNAGSAKVELDRLEKEIDTVSSPEDIDYAASKFPRGGIMAVLESSPAHYEQVARIVDKYHKKGSSQPANCLVMFHLAKGDVEKAHQLYQQYNLHNSSRLMFRSVLNRARETKNPKLLEELLSLTQGAPSITPEVKGLIYSNLIDVYSIQGDYDTGLQKLEEGLQTVPLELFYNRSLIKLKSGLEASNKPFNYTIPPKRRSRDTSSSSSSSSESEPKKSVASN